MKFIYTDLLNLLSEKPSKDQLSKKLFQLGHEHEICGEIFNMEFTPNRGDCISILGLARDLNVFFGRSKEIKIYKDNIDSLDINFQNLSVKDCPKISFLEIEIDGEISNYKNYLENYFNKLDHSKTNFFTDISNYISYELGQPTHCFDSNTLNNKLIFENRACDDKFKTLLNKDIHLKGKNCIFTDGSEIISLAGVMGGISTACSIKTKKVLVECAFFNPEAIIGKSIQYNLVSDAAHKFERGVDMESQEVVLRRFIEIVKDHATVKSMKINTFEHKQKPQNRLNIDVKKINKILGTDLEEKKYVAYLKKLGFQVKNEITIPSFRHDISSQNDLSEEIARVIGYDNIKNKPLKILNKVEKNLNKSQKIKNILVNNGLTEVINFPFTQQKDRDSVTIDNPLDSKRNHLRLTLKDSLLENLLYNERRQKDSIRLFEISNLYSKSEKINQNKKLGIIISGRRGHNYKDFSRKLDYEYLNKIMNLFSNNNNFSIEQIPRATLKTKRKEKIFYAEILISDICEEALKTFQMPAKKIDFNKYQPISEYPSSTKDFSFSVTDSKKYKTVINYINGFSDVNLKESYIFDFYENNKIKEIKVGVRFVFQSSTHTLSDKDIQKSIDNLLEPIIRLEGVTIPGL